MIQMLFMEKTKNNKKCKRGFTIVEAVIAMAVIALVSAVATSTVRRTLTTTSQDYDYEQARIHMENALETFKYCKNLAEFNSYIQIDNIHSDLSIYGENNVLRTTCSFSSTNSAYRIYITVYFPPDDSGDRPRFLGTLYGKSAQLIKIDYMKGK